MIRKKYLEIQRDNTCEGESNSERRDVLKTAAIEYNSIKVTDLSKT